MSMLKTKAEWFAAVRAQDADSILRSVHRHLGARNTLGDTALITAVRARDVQIASLLLPFEHSLLDSRGYPALGIAIELDAPELVCLLAPLEENTPVPGYGSPLALAAACGAFRSLRILSTFLCDSSIGEHETALNQAVRARHYSMIETLLETQAYAQKDLLDALDLCVDGSRSSVAIQQMLQLALKFLSSGSTLTLRAALQTIQSITEENAFLTESLIKIFTALRPIYSMVASNRDTLLEEQGAVSGLLQTHTVMGQSGQIQESIPQFMYSRKSTQKSITDVVESLADNTTSTPLSSTSIISKEVTSNYLETEDGKKLAMEVRNIYSLMTAQKDTLQAIQNRFGSLISAVSELPGCSLPLYTESSSLTPLMQAIIDNNMNTVLDTLLPYAGRKTDVGETALMLAARHGNVAAVKLLSTMEYGMQDNQGKTALRHALETSNYDSVSILIEADQKRYTDTLRESGWRCIDGTTCLSVALKNKCSFSYKYLVSREGNLSIGPLATEEFGNIEVASPLMLAVQKCRTDAIILLSPLVAGYVEPTNKRSALMLAACSGNSTAVRILAQYEAGLQDYQGYTALMYAAERNYADIVEILLPHESKMVTAASSRWSSGCTALMIAAYNGCVETVAQLILHEAGIVQTAPDIKQQYVGWSALVWAASSPEASLACIEILAEKESQHAQKALDEVPHWRDDRLAIKQLLSPYLGHEQRALSQRSQRRSRRSVH
ncbi:Protein 21.1 [Giardia lamblia P15]|uniref:Protein 21.1 n=1 Tax=Giardia intestinalis (strain P15) TaxID=658858 RepID=E1EZP8_GIAIA|nr:Protein 21.1 [Giardia lamblia P15]